MNELSNAITYLKICQKNFSKEITRINNIIKKSPEGSLLIKKPSGKNSTRYEWQRYEGGKAIRTYLPISKKLRMIQKLSDKKFAKICLENLLKALDAINIFVLNCPIPENFGIKLADQLEKKYYITSQATSVTTARYCQQWKNSFTEFLDFHNECKMHVSDDGISYRSKSESMIASELLALGITYVYDTRKNLTNGVFVYTDFIFLHPITLEEIYLEHFGMLDKEKRANRFVEKLTEYKRAGLVLGKNFFFTCETGKYPLTKEQINMTINEIIKSAAT